MAKQQNRTPEFLALNPCGKIPVLEDDGLILTESAAIMLYLAERYGEGRLLPKPGTAASGHHHQWLSFVITELEQPLWTMGKHRFALPEEQRVAAIQALPYGSSTRPRRLPSSGCLIAHFCSVMN